MVRTGKVGATVVWRDCWSVKNWFYQGGTLEALSQVSSASLGARKSENLEPVPQGGGALPGSTVFLVVITVTSLVHWNTQLGQEHFRAVVSTGNFGSKNSLFTFLRFVRTRVD